MIVSILSLALVALAQQTPIEVTPIMRQDNWWQERHQLINKRAEEAKQNCQLIFIGDSITEGWETNGKEIWESSYKKFNAINLGISGDRTEHVLWRLKNGNLTHINPSLAIIMIGTNNASNSKPEDTAEGIKSIVEELHYQKPEMKVLLLNIFPRGAEKDDPLRKKNQKVSRICDKLNDLGYVDILNINANFLEKDSRLTTEVMPDLLHLSKKGYQLWEQGISRYIKEHFAKDFLYKNMSAEERSNIPQKQLDQEVHQAFQAFESAPWRQDISEDLFLEYILPYRQLDEPFEAWRSQLRETALPIIKGYKNITEAALALNKELFKKLNVIYSTKRNRANQGPSETIATGLASCTGLSILLADACRSVGIPARVAGIAEWPDGPGNHSWVEIWDKGWHFLGAAEPDEKGLNHAWFKGRASSAIPGGRHAIWAASFVKTNTLFPLVWNPKQKFVFAEDVTARYTTNNEGGNPYSAIYEVALRYFETAESNFTFDMNLDALVLQDIKRAKEQVWKAYCDWEGNRSLQEDIGKDQVQYGDYFSPYTVKEVGMRPESGWPLVIAMHGGGGVPQEFNDSQWEHMQIYYKDHPEVSGYKYLALRAPNNLWNGFYDSYVWPLVTKLIKQFIMYGDVDSERVHLIGYSHGGYGAFAIGTRIAHRFASIHASAAAPTDGITTALNLKNTQFSFMIGEKDTAYGRADRCRSFANELAKLKENNPKQYPFAFSFILNQGHGGLPDRDLLARQLKFKRLTIPQQLAWETTDDATPDFFWISHPSPAPRIKSSATIKNNHIQISSNSDIEVWLHEKLFDFGTEDWRLTFNGEKLKTNNFNVAPNVKSLCDSALLYGDPELMFPAKISLNL
jgi:lysophospholipase L1-like esterase/dienelactone hydrolase